MADLTIQSGAESAASAAPGVITQDAIDAAVAQAEADHKARTEGRSPSEATSATDAPEVPAKPDWVEDKFWDAEKGEVNTEALAKSYQELQSKQSQAKTGDTQAEGSETSAGSDEAEVSDALKAAGFEYQALAEEFVTNGDFTDATVEKLEKVFGKELVQDYRDAKKAQFASATASYDTAVAESVGGLDTFKSVTAWAANALNAEEIAAFNADVTSGDVRRATLAAQNLQARFSAEGGKPPNLVNGGRTGAEARGGYASIEQMSKAMEDPAYRKDPAYRASVDAKIEASTHLLR